MAQDLELSIEPVQSRYALAPLQQGMLVESLSNRDEGLDITQVICALPEEINPVQLERAWQRVIERHAALRTRFEWDKNGTPAQAVEENVRLPFKFLDWNLRTDGDKALIGLLSEERKRGFDTARAPLTRVTLVRAGPSDHRLIWTFHHLIIDGRSIAIVLKEVFSIYEALIHGEEPGLAPAPAYAGFIKWLEQQDQQKAESFWRNYLKSFTTPTTLPVSQHADKADEAKEAASEQEITLSSESVARLRTFAQENEVTLNTVIQGAWSLVLSRYSGQEEVVFGAIRAGRKGTVAEAEATAGVFINTLPVRARVSPGVRLGTWLKELREQWISLRPYEHTPLGNLQSWSEAPNGRRLFETVVNVQDPSWDAALKAHGGLWAKREFRIINQPGFPLALDVYADRELILKLVYDTRKFGPSMIERMLGHLQTTLEGMAANAQQCLSDVPLLTPQEEEQLLVEWNNTSAEFPTKCVHEQFAEQAARTPRALAVVTDDCQITYSELDERANKLARRLRSMGVGPDVLVAIILNRSVEMIVSALAVLKAGGAYVPMDPAYPKERLAYMLGETTSPVLLTRSELLDKIPVTPATVICVDRQDDETGADRAASIGGPRPSNLAYVIYTSGSTGKPKGVEIEHRGLSNLVGWHQRTYQVQSLDRATQLASPAFDAAVWEIWPYLATGAAIYIPDEETRLSPEKLVRWLGEKQITFCFMPTPLAEEALSVDWPETSLKVLLTGGDRLRRGLKKKARFKLVNHYGPTENSVVTTCGEVTAQKEQASAPPIGKPIANTKVYILDRYLRPVPAGIAGELFVSGSGLARGYWNQPALTAERFIDNPFSKDGSRLYRTGDLARYLEDGNIEFLGRLDHQVKVRGYRIETGEIEVCLAGHPQISQCAVIAMEEGSETQLIGYLVSSGQQPADDELRAYVQKSLPSYMVPSAFVWLDKLPTTANGKLDRAALPAPQRRTIGTAPRTSSELLVVGIWSELLGKKDLTVESNFFELGGHSLLATRVLSRVAGISGAELSLSEFFKAPTIAAVARWLDERSQGGTIRSAISRREGQTAIMSFAQERLWFMERLQPGTAFNNIPLSIRIAGKLNVEALRGAITQVVTRHESFRTCFRSAQGRPAAEVKPGAQAPVEVVSFGALNPSERELEVRRISSEEARKPFDLEKAPLLRIKLLQLSSDEQVLLITTHHIVSDGWSIGIFYNEVAQLYDAICQEGPNPLKPLPITYSDYAAWQRESLQGAILDQQLAFWQERLKGASPALELPTDYPRPAIQTYRGATKFFALPNSLKKNLEALAQREEVTMFMLLLAAFQTLMHRYSGQDDLVVGSPVAGRKRVETEGVAGLFLNNLPLRATFPNDLTFRELLHRTKETALSAYVHQDLPFEKLVDALHLQRDLSRSPIFQVMFVLQNTPLQPLQLRGLTLTPIPLDSGTSKYDLTLGLEQQGEGLAGYVEYSTDLFSEASMARMLGHYQTLLEAVAENCHEKVSKLPILTAAEKQQLLGEWNATERAFPQKCIHELFEAQVERTPNVIAAVFEEEELTYAELNRRANVLGHRLRSMGVGPEKRVAISIKRSLEMMIALLAIHKAGGAYVPLDPSYPAERLAFMLDDSGATVLITQQELAGRLSVAGERTVIVEDFFAEPIRPEFEQNPQSGATPENVAYVIYTSGSTGKPKGVMVLHRNAANFFTGMDERIGSEPGVWLAVTSICFDISILELFWTLTRGFKVVIQSDESGFRPAAATPARATKRMDFSLFYFASDAAGGRDQYRLLIEGAKFADENGFAAVWTPERHFTQSGGLYPNPSITSAALATVTNKVQLRAGSVVLPLHNPIRVAEEWAVVDNLSNGRAAISFASGWHANDFVMAPANYASRRQIMDRDIALFRKLWAGETIVLPSGTGENGSIRIFPQPVQKEIPLWLTSSGDSDTFRMAGELGVNLLTHLSGQSTEELGEKIGIYRKAWQQSGKTGRGQVTVMLHTFVSTDMDSAWKKVRKPLWDYLKNYRDLSSSGAAKVPKVTGDIESLLNEAVSRYFGMIGLFGSPEHCCKTAETMRQAGADEIACLIDFGVDIESVLQSLRHLNRVKEKVNRTVFTGARSYSMAEQMHRHSVTHFQCTPSLMGMLAEDAEAMAGIRRMKKVMMGGEAFPLPLAERLKGDVEVLNMYGPTETTIWSTTQQVQSEAKSISIGRPIANTQIYIVDREFQPAPVNVPGELLIGGDGVARGYLNRPDLTQERFVPDPFSGKPESRLYRTGDLARYLPNGEIEYLGRADHQIKLRGFRIELGEIEAALRSHPSVREAAVVVREVGANDKRLFGYVTSSGERPSVPDIKRFLKDKLPDYMVPSGIIFLEELPLTPNGKIDRKALPAPETRRCEGDIGFVAAQSELERALARIWQQVLQIERVGLNDNFFDLGGHSLLAAQVQARIGDGLHVELPIIKLFQYPTISALAKYLSQDQKDRTSFNKVQDRARRQRDAFAWRNQTTRSVSV